MIQTVQLIAIFRKLRTKECLEHRAQEINRRPDSNARPFPKTYFALCDFNKYCQSNQKNYI